MTHTEFVAAAAALLAELARIRYAHLVIKPVLTMPAKSK